MQEKPLFTIIVPVYGNEKNIPISVPYMMEKKTLFANYETEFIFVCDGSPDNSYEELKKMKVLYPSEMTIVKFTKNFTQGAAVHCGIDLAHGSVIGVISCDLQDPFELFAEMLDAWEEGFKLVIATRSERKDKGFGVLGSMIYHKLVHRYIDDRWPEGGFDFFLMDREVADQYARYDAANGSMQMLLIWLGYEFKLIRYVRKEREVGSSGYNLMKKLNLVFGVFTTFSPIVSRIWIRVGLIMLIAALGFFICGCVSLFLGTSEIRTWGSFIMTVLFASFGLTMLQICAVGEYVWRDYRRDLNYPRYVIDEKE